MKINHDQLSQTPHTVHCYAVCGDEPLLVEETRSWLIQKHTHTHTEIIRFTPKDTSWQQFVLHCQHGSLLATEQIIDVRLESNKLTAEVSALLVQCIRQLPQQVTLIMSTAKLDAKTQYAPWVKAIDQHGLIVQIWKLNPEQLFHWIKQRAQQHGYSLTTAAVYLIRDQCEGNLLAANQVIKKLTLIPSQTIIDVDIIQQILVDSHQYDVFTWVDACLIGDIDRMEKILVQLKATRVEPTLLVWSFTREIRILISLQQHLLAGHTLNEAMKREAIYLKKKPIYQRLLLNTELVFWGQLFKKILQVDYMIKGVIEGDYWKALNHLGRALAMRELGTHDE